MKSKREFMNRMMVAICTGQLAALAFGKWRFNRESSWKEWQIRKHRDKYSCCIQKALDFCIDGKWTSAIQSLISAREIEQKYATDCMVDPLIEQVFEMEVRCDHV